MNSSNLINPFLPSEQRAWRHWILISGCLLGASIVFFVALTANLYWKLSCLKKRINSLQNSLQIDGMSHYEVLQKKQIDLKQKLKRIRQWQQRLGYHDYFYALSETIPGSVMLSTVVVEKEDIILKGQSQTIEGLLGFVHALEQTSLFQSMNIAELQPSSLVYKEKNLVNFTINGKLSKVI